MRAEMIEIDTERVWISPKVASLSVEPERSRPQLGKIVGLTGKTNDDVRFEAIGTPRHYLRHDTERWMLGVIG
jgi:hypothetical protein